MYVSSDKFHMYNNINEQTSITNTSSIADNMVAGEKVKQILYSIIEETGKENIQVSISSNMNHHKNTFTI